MPQALTESIAANGSGAEAASRRNFWGLTLGCIGVVYGDIGTSPLYALRESWLGGAGRGPAHGLARTRGGGGEGGPRRARASDPRHSVAYHLGADPHRHREICAD